MKKTLFLFIILPLCVYSLDEKPWLGDPWEFTLSSDFTYSRYRRVQDAAVQLPQASNDRLLSFDLGVAPWETIDVQMEVEFANTPRQRWGLRSGAIQARFAWMDDISGDPISLTTGVIVRGVSGNSRRDVSSPYHAPLDMELNAAAGKEWSQEAFFGMRTWGLLGVGTGNQGMPWTRAIGAFEKNWDNHHRLGVLTEGYFGFGTKHHANTDHFNGWGKFHHQSIDLGVFYQYHFDLWGDISLSYDYRVFARVFPENVNFFTLSYKLPFSFF